MSKIKDFVPRKIITVADESVHQANFTIVPNEIINHSKLSERSKLLIIYLISKSSDYQFYDESIRAFLKCGRDALEGAFRELRDTGYVANVAVLDEQRKVCGSKRVFSNYPKFISKKPHLSVVKPRCPEKPGSLENPRCPEKPGPVETRASSPLYTNTDLVSFNKNNNSTNTPREGDVAVVDFSGDKQMELLVKKLIEYGASKLDAEKWAKVGPVRVDEVIRLMDERRATIQNEGAFMRKAFDLGWMPSGKPRSPTVATKKPTYDEFMSWVKNDWWPLLTDKEKESKFEEVKSRSIVFNNLHGSTQRQDIVLKSFDSGPIFKFMIDLLFPVPSRL